MNCIKVVALGVMGVLLTGCSTSDGAGLPRTSPSPTRTTVAPVDGVVMPPEPSGTPLTVEQAESTMPDSLRDAANDGYATVPPEDGDGSPQP